MVGMAARTRVSSVTTPSFRGTLKSTRIRTRLPSTSASRTVFLVKAMLTPLLVEGANTKGARPRPESCDRTP